MSTILYNFSPASIVPFSISSRQTVVDECRTFTSTSARPLIVILGPTASGKTGFSLELAALLSRPAEIINADSRQLYRYLNIGTAKITPEEMNGIPHHLLDVLDPSEDVTASWYKDAATNVIDDILARTNIPMLVGGSMLYLSAIIDDLRFPSAADPILRSRLEQEYDADGGVSLMKSLEDLDPESASSIPMQNKLYLIRALELCIAHDEPASRTKTMGECPYDLFIIGIAREREELISRINDRIQIMMNTGWVEECMDLLARRFTPSDPGLKSHGYREIIGRILELRSQNTSNPQIIETLKADRALHEKIASQTRHYAKRQMTWWKHDPRIHWLSL